MDLIVYQNIVIDYGAGCDDGRGLNGFDAALLFATSVFH